MKIANKIGFGYLQTFAKRVEIDGKTYVLAEDHDAEIDRVRGKAVSDYKRTEEFQSINTKLQGYTTKERTNEIQNTHFKNFKVKGDYSEEVMKLAGISVDMEDKEIKKALTDFSKNPKYTTFFDVEDEQSALGNADGVVKQEENKTGIKAGGGGFWKRK